MKLFLLVCLLGISAADFLQDAATAVERSVSAFKEGATSIGSLSEALGIDDPILDQLAEDIEDELEKSVKEAFQDLLQKIKDNVDNGKAVGQELLEKVKELRKKLKDLGLDVNDKTKETFQKIKEKAKEALKKILERLGLGKRNIDDSMDQIARLKFLDIVEKIRDKLTSEEAIQKIRNYANRLQNTPLGKEIKTFLSKVPDSKLKDVISNVLKYTMGNMDKREMVETWDKIKDFFKDLNVKIQEHSKRFGEWVKSVWGKGLDKMREKYGAVKAIAMEFIISSKDMSAETAREALDFFRPYKDDLGTLWQQIVDAAKEAIGNF